MGAFGDRSGFPRSRAPGARLAVAAIAACMGLVASPSLAADPTPLAMRSIAALAPITPRSAADARAPIQAKAKSMHESGDDVDAANMLIGEAERLKDPVLYLDAADIFLSVAQAELNIEWLDGAQQMADIAGDMLYYLRDHGVSQQWQPVAAEHVAIVLERAQGFEARATTAREEIEAELAAGEETPEGPPEPKNRPSKGLFLTGAVLTGVGVAGLGVAGAGMAIGAKAQSQVTDPLVYQAEHEAAEARGRTGNILAYVGGGLGVIGLGSGIALMVLAKKRERAAGSEVDAAPSSEDPTVAILPGLRGLTIKGTF